MNGSLKAEGEKKGIPAGLGFERSLHLSRPGATRRISRSCPVTAAVAV